MRMRPFMTLLAAIAFAVAFFAMPAGASALTVVEPDAYAVGTNISNAFPGITLSAPGSGWNNAGPDIFSIDPLAWLEPFTASTGSLVFGTSDGSFPHLFMTNTIGLQVDFASPTAYAQIDFIGNNAHDVGVLSAYDSSWSLIDQVTTGVIVQDQVGTISVSSALSNISYLVAIGGPNSSVGIDNLQYGTPVPEPSTLCLVILGTIGLAIKRFKS